MAKCKYPNEVCGNMTIYHGVAYCGSVPCSLKDELPKQTNGDRIRNLTNKDLAEFLYCHIDKIDDYTSIEGKTFYDEQGILEWLESECDTEC